MSYYNKPPISGAAGAHNAGVYTIDGKGRTKVYAYAAAAAVKNTLYMMAVGQYGPQNEAMGTAANLVKVMVAEKALATGQYGWFVTQGEIDVITASDACTAGHTWKIHTDGTAVSEDAAWGEAANPDRFAVATQTEGTLALHTMYLTGEDVTWT